MPGACEIALNSGKHFGVEWIKEIAVAQNEPDSLCLALNESAGLKMIASPKVRLSRAAVFERAES